MVEKWAMILLIGVALFFAGFLKGCQHGQREHEVYLAKMEAASAELLLSVNKRNTALKNKYVAEAKERDRRYDKDITKIRSDAAAAVDSALAVGLFDPGQSSGGAATPGAGCTGAIAEPPAERRLSDGLTRFLIKQAGLADETRLYAEHCYRFVNKLPLTPVEEGDKKPE